MKLKATETPSGKTLGQLFREVVHGALADAMQVDDDGQLKKFLTSLSQDYTQAKQEADSLTKEQAEQKIKEIIDGVTLEQYKTAIKEKKWPWNSKPDKEGYSAFMYSVVRTIDFAVLIDTHKITKKKITGWIKENIDRTFPPPNGVEPLPKMPNKPKKHISANNKLMTALTNNSIINGGEVNLSVMPNDGITTYVMAVYEPDKEMDSFNLSPFERTVMDAVCSIYLQAIRDGIDSPVMTPASIYKAMPGGGPKATAAKQKEIAEAYTKMRHIFVKLDATSELLKRKKIKQGETYTKETNMLLAEEHIYMRQNGTTSIGWQLFQKPVILDYAEMTGQLVNVPAKVMQIEGVKATGEPDGLILSMNENRRELLAYLVRRVAVIKHAQEDALREASWKKNQKAGKSWQELMKKSPLILFESSFTAAGLETTRKSTIKECKDFCRNVMAYWVAIGYIHGYEEVKEGRTAKGLKILFADV